MNVIDSLKGFGAHRRILKLGFPILVGQLGMIVVGFADTKMVGLYATDALASASFVNNVFTTAIFACIGFTYGLTPLIGALFTQGRLGHIGATLKNGLALNSIFALLVTLVMALLYLNLESLGQPAELIPLIRPYYLTCLAGVVPIAIFNVFAQWTYALNLTAMPMWITLAANALNILGNWLLIYGNWGCPEMGLLGAGVATLAARVMCPLAIIAVFARRKRFAPYREGFVGRRLNMREARLIFNTSLPVSLQTSLESASFSVAALMAGWISAVSLAAFQIIVMVGTLGFCVYYSFAAAVAVLVSNAAGASDKALMRHVAFSGYQILLALATISSLVFIVFGKELMHQFTHDPAVLSASVALVVPLVLYQYGDATQINFANALRGTSKVKPMVWIAFVSYAVVGTPATYLLAFTAGMGCYGIVLSFSVSLFLAAALFTYYFLRSTRRMDGPLC